MQTFSLQIYSKPFFCNFFPLIKMYLFDSSQYTSDCLTLNRNQFVVWDQLVCESVQKYKNTSHNNCTVCCEWCETICLYKSERYVFTSHFNSVQQLSLNPYNIFRHIFVTHTSCTLFIIIIVIIISIALWFSTQIKRISS